MFKNLKIGAKLAVGFGVILGIFIIVGSISWMDMDKVSKMSTKLAGAYVPEIRFASGLERVAQDLAYHLTSYLATDDAEYLDEIRENMKAMELSLSEIKEHGERYKLPVLIEAEKEASKEFKVFTINFDKTVDLMKAVKNSRDGADKSALLYMESAYSFLSNQNKMMERDVSLGLSSEMLTERLIKIKLINEIIDKCNVVRIKVLKAQLQKNPEAIEQALVDLKKTDEDLKDLIKITEVDEDKKSIEGIRIAETSYRNAINKLLTEWDNLEEKKVVLNSSLQKIMGNSRSSAIAGVKESEEIAISAASDLQSTTSVLLAGFLIAILLGIIVAFFIARMITKPLINAVGLAHRAKDGDLTITRDEFKTDSRDEIGQLVDALAEMLAGQKNMVTNVADMILKAGQGAETLASLSEETNASMEEIRSAVEQVSDLSESNSAALEESNAGVQEVASGAQNAAQSSAQGASAAENTQREAKAVVEQVQGVNDDINVVGAKSKESIENLSKLADSVKEIAKFVNIITGIADQTNLLALNAAIEAARAGDAGRGFAVVADEVRKLAEESNRSAQEVAGLIETLKENAAVSMSVTKESGDIMEGTMKRSGEAHGKLVEMLKDIIKVEEATQNIASVSQEQAASSEEIAAAIDQATNNTMKIVEMVENVKSSSAEASDASESVALEAQDLLKNTEQVQALLSQFKLVSNKDSKNSVNPEIGQIAGNTGLVEI